MERRERETTLIRVAVVQDPPLLRGAVAALLAKEEDFEVLAEPDRDADLLAVLREQRAEVLIVDIDQCPGRSPSPLTGMLPDCQILMISDRASVEVIREALEAGVRGFVGKDFPPGRLADAVRRIRSGQRVIDPALGRHLLRRAGNPLTDRQRAVLREAAEGHRSAEIARRLNLAPGTVRNYLSAIIRKLGVRTRLEAIRRAYEEGWL